MAAKIKSTGTSAVTWLVAALVSGSLILPFQPPFRTEKSAYAFEADVGSSARGIVQLFFDVGRGFNEQDSSIVQIRGGGGPLHFKFRLPFGHYSALRFDPLDHPGVITLSGALIRDSLGRVVMRFPPSRFQATNQIQRMSEDGGTLTMETVPGANDPNTIIRLDGPFDLTPPPSRQWVKSVEWFAGVFAILAVAIASAPRLAGAGALVLGMAERRPKRALALVSLGALLLNCFPVIFCGRSFVSPNNGVVLLYQEIPTLPGYENTDVKDSKGSDVGAAMWWHVPISRVQNQAIFHDHELPLWNRYDLCGQSLLGQGQSMIGDPLHLVTAVLSGGRAWAWDAKYLVAKWLFAFGMGLTVLAVTDRLGVAALLSASSLYIGFFSFCLNHPAFFSVCYAPWILYSWIRIAGAAGVYEAVGWTCALIASDWVEINSGTVKEAYVLAGWLNLAGLLALLLNRDGRALKLRKTLTVCWANVLFVLISAPIWLTFLDTLGRSFTSYIARVARQIPATRLLGFFEDLFYRQASKDELHVAPATNFLVLLGILWALSHAKRLSRNRMFLALGASAVVPLLLVYGIIPKAAIIAVPFLGNILHIDATFSCVLIVLAIPVAGIGLKSCLDSLRDEDWLAHFSIVICLLGAMLGLYFGLDRHLSPSAFFDGYVPTILAAFVVIQLAARQLAKGSPNAAGAVLLIVLGLFAIHWRQGQYLKTAFDDYVLNPQVRVDLRAESPAVRFSEGQKRVPSRTTGMGLNLFPGFNCMYLVENIFGVDALRSPEYEDLAEALGLERVLTFTSFQAKEGSRNFRAAYDALNVAYFLDSSQPTPGEYGNWEKVNDLDLTVYRSPSAWPRAYFVDQVAQYDQLPELVEGVRAAHGRPFAAVQAGDLPDLPQLGLLPSDPSARRVVAASGYLLTNNTTSFDVDAPGPGVVVLLETWLKDDFEATVNGRPASYFRVNHAFKGILIESAGRYRISFSYWPRHLALALWMSALGTLLGCGSLLFVCIRHRARQGAAGA